MHEGATEGCANGSSSTGMTNSAPGVEDKHVVRLEGSMGVLLQRDLRRVYE